MSAPQPAPGYSGAAAPPPASLIATPVAKPAPAARKGFMQYLDLPDLSNAFVRPAHLKSSYVAFLLMVGGFTLAQFANLGIGGIEQIFLVNEFGRTAQESSLPPTMALIAGCLSFFWANITDRYNFFGYGYRLPYVIIGQSVTLATYLATALFPGGPATEGGWAIYVSMYLIRGFAMSMAGSALSGWIIDANVRDRIGMIQVAGAVGRMIGLAAVITPAGNFTNEFGFLPNFVLLCGAICSPFLVIPLTLTRAIVEEKDPKAADEAAAAKAAKAEPSAGFFADIVRAVKREMGALSLFGTPAGIAIIVLTVTGAVGNITGNFLINLFLVNQKGLTIVDISHLGTVSLVVNFPGSVFAAYALDNWDCRWSIFWMNAITAGTTVALIWTPRNAAFWYNVGLNVIGSCTGQAAQTLISGVALRAAPPKLGASFMAVIGTVTALVGIVGNQLGGHISTLDDSFTLSFITGTCVILSGCIVVPFLGDTAKVPKPAAAEEAEAAAKAKAGALPGAAEGATVATNPLALTLKGDVTGAELTAVAVKSVNSAPEVEDWKPTRRV